MVREAEVAYASCLAFIQQELEQSIVEEPSAQGVHASAADGVEQVIVNIIHSEPLERFQIHLLRSIEIP